MWVNDRWRGILLDRYSPLRSKPAGLVAASPRMTTAGSTSACIDRVGGPDGRGKQPFRTKEVFEISPRPLAEVRQRQIVALLQESGSLRIAELSQMLDVSDETVRRDLAVLQEQGLLTRTRGGALVESVSLETSFQRRMRENGVEKREIARIAASYVEDGSTIIIDSGSTMAHLVNQLRSKRDLVVITNGINHVEDLLSNPSLTVVVTGGMVRRVTMGAAGPLAAEALSSLHADHTFLAAHGFSAEAGMMYPSFDEVAVKRAMITAGAEVTLLADGTKCGRASMVKVAPLGELNRIITSPPIPESEQSKIRDLGVELILAEIPDNPELSLVDQPGPETGDLG
jgi:DeoR family fructose operon transcriptional repressor